MGPGGGARAMVCTRRGAEVWRFLRGAEIERFARDADVGRFSRAARRGGMEARPDTNYLISINTCGVGRVISHTSGGMGRRHGSLILLLE